MKTLVYGKSGKLGSCIYKMLEDNGYNPSFASSRNIVPIDNKIDIIIEATTSIAIENIAKAAFDIKKPLVICTTNIDSKIFEKIEEYAKDIPIFISPNMSFGVHIFKKILKKAAIELKEYDFDIEIIEKHHNKKIDSPSGTAISIKNLIQNEYKSEIPIHSIRAGSIFGEHSAIFAGHGEIIELSHTALSRDIFAKGAILAAKFLIKQSPGIYNMEDLN